MIITGNNTSFNNGNPILLADIPVLSYASFFEVISRRMSDPACHCFHYFGHKQGGNIRFFFLLADDSTGLTELFSFIYINEKTLPSLSVQIPSLQLFEREIAEDFGIIFEGHPWPKPVRFPYLRAGSGLTMNQYPFYLIEGEELHEVGVGPVHAGVIEPGHFRFICSGEKVLHLEIQLGYQHRGIEELMIKPASLLKKQMIAESIAGDTAIGHGLAHAMLIESLAGIQVSQRLQAERILALELERIAVHIGDSAALFNDIAYQLGQVVNEALRTVIINSTQLWCGNRFGKGLIRAGGSRYHLQSDVNQAIAANLADVTERYNEMADRALNMPGVLMRFDNVGIFSQKQAQLIGAVGFAARSSGLVRDTRASHSFQIFREIEFKPDVLETGDLLARFNIRRLEIDTSQRIVRQCLTIISEKEKEASGTPAPDSLKFKPDSLAISITEGWRGEIVHAALTNESGEIIQYKVKDPSFHNWLALALAVRNHEISDFPVCNKSFNLSYCGFDL